MTNTDIPFPFYFLKQITSQRRTMFFYYIFSCFIPPKGTKEKPAPGLVYAMRRQLEGKESG